MSHNSSPVLASYNVSHHAVFHYFCLITTNRIPQPQLNTVNKLLNCCKTEQYYFLTLLLYGKIRMVVWSNIAVWLRYIYYQSLYMHIISWCLSTMTRQRGCWCFEFYGKTASFNVNGKCAISWFWRVWQIYDNTHLSTKRWHKSCKGI